MLDPRFAGSDYWDDQDGKAGKTNASPALTPTTTPAPATGKNTVKKKKKTTIREFGVEKVGKGNVNGDDNAVKKKSTTYGAARRSASAWKRKSTEN